MGILTSFKLGTRYCYLDGSYIASLFDERDGAEQLASDLLDALLDQLEAPGKAATLRALANREKLKIVERQIEHFRGTETSLW